MRTLQEREGGLLRPTDQDGRLRVEPPLSLVREALKQAGYTFFAKVQPISFKELLARNPDAFDCPYPFDDIAGFFSQEREVAINPDQLFVPYKGDPRQQRLLIKEDQRRLQQEDPKLRDVFFEIVNASVYAQLDKAYQESEGEPLIKGGFACTSDKTGENSYAYVGRLFRDQRKLVVSSWRGDNPFIKAVPVAILPQM